MVQDAREKRNYHNNIEDYCKKINLPIIRKRLEVGDYRLANIDENGNIEFINNISVDVKGVGGLEELASDLYRDSKELNKKYKKCFHSGIKLIVLIQEDINCMDELLEWKSKHSKINGRFLVYLIHTLQISYGIRFIFCNPQDTGAKILELLKE
jgi:ERCC4-type nuclease